VRILRWLIGLLLVAILAAAVSYFASAQPRRDAVAAAERELGIHLDSRRVSVGDVTLHVVIAGPENGEPVVLLHGFPEFWYAWRFVMARLVAAGFRVIAPDQRGYNESDKPDGIEAYRVDVLADDVAALIAALGYQKRQPGRPRLGRRHRLADGHPPSRSDPPLRGHRHAASTGARRFREQGGHGHLVPDLHAAAVDPRDQRARRQLLAPRQQPAEHLAPGHVPRSGDGSLRSAWDQPGARTATTNWYRAAFRFPSHFDGEQRVAVPTLVIVAPKDAFIPGDVTRRSTRFLDHGQLVELASGTHWVVQEEPEVISRLLIEFFAGGGPPS
jgi:pimeloyl-ACP methyl ester carboxylesterase